MAFLERTSKHKELLKRLERLATVVHLAHEERVALSLSLTLTLSLTLSLTLTLTLTLTPALSLTLTLIPKQERVAEAAGCEINAARGEEALMITGAAGQRQARAANECTPSLLQLTSAYLVYWVM